MSKQPGRLLATSSLPHNASRGCLDTRGCLFVGLPLPSCQNNWIPQRLLIQIWLHVCHFAASPHVPKLSCSATWRSASALPSVLPGLCASASDTRQPHPTPRQPTARGGLDTRGCLIGSLPLPRYQNSWIPQRLLRHSRWRICPFAAFLRFRSRDPPKLRSACLLRHRGG